LKATAAGIARQGLSGAKVDGATSSIPKSQVGALLYDVGRELETMDEDMTEVAVGYYMAALADPEGERHGDAKRRLHEIFLDDELSHDEAVRLYDGGKAILDGLSEPRIGLTRDGLAAGRQDLEKLKRAYHQRRAVRGPVDSASSGPLPSPADPTPSSP
jgi:hypothetical protein